MSVETTNNSVQYTPDGVNKVFDITYPFISASDIQLWTVDNSGLSTQILSNFSVNTTTKQVTYPVTGSAISPSDVSKIFLLRVNDLKQEITLTTQGPFPADSLNTAHDKLTMICQQLQGQIDRAIIAPVGGTFLTPSEYFAALDSAVISAASSAASALVSKDAAEAAAATMVKATQAQAEAASDDTAYMTALKVKYEVQKSGAVSIPANNIGNGITEAQQTLADNTTNDVSASKHGYCPKLPNNTTTFLRGDGSFSIPSGKVANLSISRDMTAASGDVAYTGVGFTPKVITIVMSGYNQPDFSSGCSSGVGNDYCCYKYIGGSNFNADAYLTVLELSAGNAQWATLKSFDADGFTLTWLKQGSPTGNAGGYVILEG